MTSPPAIRAMGALEWFLLLILAVFWGGSFFFVGIAVESLPPFTIVALRIGIAALALNLIVLATGGRGSIAPRLWGPFLILGLLNNLIPFSLIVWGQTHIASGLASILNATTPIFSIILAHYVTADEKMTPLRILGVGVGFAGLSVMIGVEVLAGLGVSVLAQGAVVAASVSYACGAIYGRRFKGLGVSPLSAATGQVSAAAILLIPLAAIIDRPWTLANPAIEVWAAILALALVSTVLAYILYFRILQTSGATNLMLVTFLIPVVAIFLGILFLGEALAPSHLAGMGMIFLGLIAITRRPAGR